MKIYLDVCCLNRPFDDQTQDRIRLESEAVLTILSRCQSGEWQLVGSQVIEFEISKIPDGERRQKVSILARLAGLKVPTDEGVRRCAVELQNLGFKPVDALHISSAEKGNTDVFLTTDDNLLRKASQKDIMIKVKVANPLKWFTEVMESEKQNNEP
jgi:predicted nucleic acid-binding protein